jgi:hypothetical protein
LEVAPDAVVKDLHKIDDDPTTNEESKALSKDLLHVIGSVTLGMALLIVLTLIRPIHNNNKNIERAIGLSLLPRLFVIGSKLPRYPTRMLIVNTVITGCATASMLTGRGAVASKVFPTMSLAKALFLRWRPKEASRKFFAVSDIHRTGTYTTTYSSQLWFAIV